MNINRWVTHPLSISSIYKNFVAVFKEIHANTSHVWRKDYLAFRCVNSVWSKLAADFLICRESHHTPILVWIAQSIYSSSPLCLLFRPIFCIDLIPPDSWTSSSGPITNRKTSSYDRARCSKLKVWKIHHDNLRLIGV